MLATRMAESAGLRLITVPLPARWQGVMLRCPTGLVNVLVADHLGPGERQRVVRKAIEAARRGKRASLLDTLIELN